MAFTFTVKIWRKERPKSAEGSNVAKSITAVEKANKKALTAMNENEVKTASDALNNLKSAFDVAKKKIAADKKNKDRSKINGLIGGWQSEINDGLKDLRDRGYQIKVEKVAAQFQMDWDYSKDLFDDKYRQAKAAYQDYQRDGALPEPRFVQTWLNEVRDMGVKCSKDAIKNMGSPPEPKQVKPGDVPRPPETKAYKSKIVELRGWCDEFATAIKKGVKGKGANLSDTKAIEKELKGILADYKKVGTENKKLIKKSGQLEATAKQLAEMVKTEIGAGNTDEVKFGKIAKALSQTATLLLEADGSVIGANSTYRESSGDLSKRCKVFRDMEGYDAGSHGKVIADQMNAAMLSVRQATVGLKNGRRQILRAKRLLEDSSSHRGFASSIPSVPS